MTGEGLEDLRDAIASVLDASPSADLSARPRMWVDRTFTIAGAGQVVTGTLGSGILSVGDAVLVLPTGEHAKVRGIHHHGGEVEQARAGDRTALNLPGTDSRIDRGALITTEGGATTARRLVLSLSPTRAVGSIPDRGAFHLHIGTASHPARLRRLDDGFFIASLDERCPVVVGDRVILRDSGRKAVVGGGRVVDIEPRQRRSPTELASLATAVEGTPDDVATTLVAIHGQIDRDALSSMTSGGTPTGAVEAGSTWVVGAVLDGLTEQASASVEQFHANNPTRPGIGKAALASKIGVDGPILDAIVARSDSLVYDNDVVRLGTFSNELSDEEEQRWRRAREELETSFNVPRMNAIPVDQDTLHFLIRRGDLVRIDSDLVFTRAQVDRMLERLPQLGDRFTVAEFRDHFDMARRQAVPTLEWLDATGVTRRSGDVRSLR